MRLSASSKLFLFIALNNLRLQIKSITSQTKLHVYCKHDFGLHTRGSLISTLDSTKIMMLKKKLLIYLMKYFIFKFGKKHNQSGSKYTQNMYRNTG